jgi:HEAT repeat protein
VMRLASGPEMLNCRESAAGLLQRMASDGRVSAAALVRLMEDPSARVRIRAAEGLGRLARTAAGEERSTAVQRLMGAAMCDPDESVRRRAIDSLGTMSGISPEAAGVFTRAARDPAPRVRARTMYALYACPKSSNVESVGLSTVAMAARDSDASVREAAMFALWRLGQRLEGAVLVLGLSLRDGSVEVRRSAADQLARLGPKAAPAWGSLMAGLADADPLVQASVVEALVAIGS